ncbi:MAG TPA: glutamate-cysteine ligase family protein [Gemmatimonadaceae bacterium]|nr:glutamate-cysteine ligase family protein [Gemmatimonadaceae bacterium]
MTMIVPGGAGGRALLAADLERRAFSPSRPRARRIGAEVELLPLDAVTRCIAPLEHVVLPLLRRFGAPRCWVESRTEKGTPCFRVPAGGRLTFEPGGQIEYAAQPAPNASALIAELRLVLEPLRRFASRDGLDFVSSGIEAERDVWWSPRQLDADRYARMEAYFATIGPHGARMMRQTASFQVCLDIGAGTVARRRWRVLNAAAPYVVAIFANSPRYDGTLGDHQSVRADCWRRLDPLRTGVMVDDDAVPSYLAFALRARDMMRRMSDGTYRPFGDWLDDGDTTLDDWHHHLTTLFPEVRPRGYFEMRGADSIDPAWCPAPLALLGGLAYDDTAVAEALDVLGDPAGRLECAGRAGLRDSGIADAARQLVDIALRGCVRLGDGFLSGTDLDVARAYFDRYTHRGRAPADDVRDAAAPAPAPA